MKLAISITLTIVILAAILGIIGLIVTYPAIFAGIATLFLAGAGIAFLGIIIHTVIWG